MIFIVLIRELTGDPSRPFNQNAPAKDAFIRLAAMYLLGIMLSTPRQLFPALNRGLARCQGADPGNVAHLAAGAGLGLAIEMDQHIGLGSDLGQPVDISTDQVFHHAIGMPLGIA